MHCCTLAVPWISTASGAVLGQNSTPEFESTQIPSVGDLSTWSSVSRVSPAPLTPVSPSYLISSPVASAIDRRVRKEERFQSLSKKLNQLKAIYWVYLTIVGAYLIYGYVTKSGLYALLIDAQLKWFGKAQ